MEAARDALESKLGYKFRNRELLQRALTHRSWLEGRPASNSSSGDNEQLEFLGDAILGFVVSEVLVIRFAKAKEGPLSRWKAHLVSAAHLHRCALTLGLGEYLLLGRGEDRNGGRERQTLLADATEALIAALYLDGGIEPARAFIEANILQYGSNLDELSLSNNQKVDLQNKARSLGLPAPRYAVVAEEGPDHAKVFVVEARVGDAFVSRAKATTKRTASLLAAKQILEQLQADSAK
ncbi:MAG: ribonuclease III [Bryobacteraceae bacterium]